jgi:hypothetical protein
VCLNTSEVGILSVFCLNGSEWDNILNMECVLRPPGGIPIGSAVEWEELCKVAVAFSESWCYFNFYQLPLLSCKILGVLVHLWSVVKPLSGVLGADAVV